MRHSFLYCFLALLVVCSAQSSQTTYPLILPLGSDAAISFIPSAVISTFHRDICNSKVTINYSFDDVCPNLAADGEVFVEDVGANHTLDINIASLIGYALDSDFCDLSVFEGYSEVFVDSPLLINVVETNFNYSEICDSLTFSAQDEGVSVNIFLPSFCRGACFGYTPEPTATPTPTEEPTTTPTAEPSATPTASPTEEPTNTPTAEPSATPTAEPSASPTPSPTEEPTATPTAEPSATPTPTPTEEPTATPIPTPIADCQDALEAIALGPSFSVVNNEVTIVWSLSFRGVPATPQMITNFNTYCPGFNLTAEVLPPFSEDPIVLPLEFNGQSSGNKRNTVVCAPDTQSLECSQWRSTIMLPNAHLYIFTLSLIGPDGERIELASWTLRVQSSRAVLSNGGCASEDCCDLVSDCLLDIIPLIGKSGPKIADDWADKDYICPFPACGLGYHYDSIEARCVKYLGAATSAITHQPYTSLRDCLKDYSRASQPHCTTPLEKAWRKCKLAVGFE